jgi:hypothetical protein
MPRLSAVAVLDLNGAAVRQRNRRLGRSGFLSADCGCPRGSPVPLRQVAMRLPCRTSAPGLGSPLPHICAGTGLTPAAHLRRDWARPAHICAVTGLAPATSCPRSLFSETSRARISRSRSAETVSSRTLSLRWVRRRCPGRLPALCSHARARRVGGMHTVLLCDVHCPSAVAPSARGICECRYARSQTSSRSR